MFESKQTSLFWDMEFTGLHQNTTPISIGIISQDRTKTFYAEFNDFDQIQVDDWIRENVIKKLIFFNNDFSVNRSAHESIPIDNTPIDNVSMYGNRDDVVHELKTWLSQFESVKFWGDVTAYDWVLFCELFGGAMNLPKNVYYICFDISTMLAIAGIDPDINRTDFINSQWNFISAYASHNSLIDAKQSLDCYESILKMESFQQKLEAK